MRASTQRLGAVGQSLWLSDSGAGETVMPVDWVDKPSYGQSPMVSRANDFYTTADGSKVYDEGQRKIGCLHI